MKRPEKNYGNIENKNPVHEVKERGYKPEDRNVLWQSYSSAKSGCLENDAACANSLPLKRPFYLHLHTLLALRLHLFSKDMETSIND